MKRSLSRSAQSFWIPSFRFCFCCSALLRMNRINEFIKKAAADWFEVQCFLEKVLLEGTRSSNHTSVSRFSPGWWIRTVYESTAMKRRYWMYVWHNLQGSHRICFQAFLKCWCLLKWSCCFLCWFRFDNELTQALEEADNEREQKDKAFQENATLGTEIYTLRRNLQVCLCIFYSFLCLYKKPWGGKPLGTNNDSASNVTDGQFASEIGIVSAFECGGKQ